MAVHAVGTDKALLDMVCVLAWVVVTNACAGHGCADVVLSLGLGMMKACPFGLLLYRACLDTRNFLA